MSTDKTAYTAARYKGPQDLSPMKQRPSGYYQTHLEPGPSYKGILYRRTGAAASDIGFNLAAAELKMHAEGKINGPSTIAERRHNVQYGMAIQRIDFDQRHQFLNMPSNQSDVVLVKSLAAGSYSLPRMPARPPSPVRRSGATASAMR